MSIAFLDNMFPTRLPSRRETLDFEVIDSDPNGLVVSMMLPDGTMETIFQAGLIGREYTVTREGVENRIFHVKRSGLWPAGRFSFAFTEAQEGGGGGGGIYAALTPTLYSPVAQYALQGTGSTIWFDRSGNALPLTAGVPTKSPDLIVGQTAARPVVGSRMKRVGAQAALQITGDLTVTARVKRDVGGAGPIAIMSGIFSSGDATKNTLYSLSVLSDGSLEAFWEITSGISTTRQSTTGMVLPSVWQWVSWRRDATTGRWTFGSNTAYDVSTTAPGTSGGSAAFLNIGDNDEAPDLTFGGLIADVSIWNVRLTDVELETLYHVAMGV